MLLKLHFSCSRATDLIHRKKLFWNQNLSGKNSCQFWHINNMLKDILKQLLYFAKYIIEIRNWNKYSFKSEYKSQGRLVQWKNIPFVKRFRPKGTAVRSPPKEASFQARLICNLCFTEILYQTGSSNHATLSRNQLLRQPTTVWRGT